MLYLHWYCARCGAAVTGIAAVRVRNLVCSVGYIDSRSMLIHHEAV